MGRTIMTDMVLVDKKKLDYLHDMKGLDWEMMGDINEWLSPIPAGDVLAVLKEMATRKDVQGCEQCLCCGYWRGMHAEDHSPTCTLDKLIKQLEGK